MAADQMLNTGGRRICVACRYFDIWKGQGIMYPPDFSFTRNTDPLLKVDTLAHPLLRKV